MAIENVLQNLFKRINTTGTCIYGPHWKNIAERINCLYFTLAQSVIEKHLGKIYKLFPWKSFQKAV